MKTKVIAIALFAMMSFLTSNAQTYQPIFGVNSTKYSQLGAFGSYEYSINGDTLISGKKYKILDYSGFVRATDDNSKMYFVRNSAPNLIYDKDEYLIMDLNMKLGDKFIINDTLRYAQYYPMTIGSDTLTVDSVYSLNGIKHIRFNTIMNHPIAINGLSIKYKFEFIEGVGPNIGFAIRPRTVKLRQDNPDSGPILCSFKDNNKFFSTNLLKGTIFDGECTLKGDGVTQNKMEKIRIYPNPASTKLVVSIDETGNSYYNAEILDMTGNTIYSKPISANISEISLNNLPTSIYLIRLTSENGKPYCKQFIVKRI